ncbi:hypothetical protein [Terribacillus saccharophilus]|nr:hypothetical protein [Terribacillus saccharophilus]
MAGTKHDFRFLKKVAEAAPEEYFGFLRAAGKPPRADSGLTWALIPR